LTNAVKHFKFVQRGKLRMHDTPRLGQVTACRPWLAAEIAVVQPKVLLCLGANASKSVLGSGFSLLKDHGKRIASTFCDRVYATIHPSAVLRAPDEERRRQLHGWLRTDLERAWLDAQGR
jgi:DNA polymerase